MKLRSAFVDARGSPSLRPREVVDDVNDGVFLLGGHPIVHFVEDGGALHDPDSPCVCRFPLELSVSAERDVCTEPDSQVSIPMKKATCQRASRAARANDPSSEATMRAYNLMYQTFQRIKREKIERAPREFQAFKSFKPSSGSGGKGVAVRTSQQHQSKMNHLASLKAKDVDTNNTEPAFLLGGFTAPLLWDRLAENSLKSNAVNSSVSVYLMHILQYALML